MKGCLFLLMGMFLVSQVFAATPTTMMKGMKHHLPGKIVTKKPSKLVECPVTKTKIDPAKAYSKTVYKGKTYYFCCAGCPEEFKKNPGRYVK